MLVATPDQRPVVISKVWPSHVYVRVWNRNSKIPVKKVFYQPNRVTGDRTKMDFEAEVPFTIATVELEEGARAFGRLEGSEPGAPGGAVVATYVDHAEWTELRFIAREDAG